MPKFFDIFASFRFCGKRGIRTAKPSPTRQRSRNLRLAISRGGNPLHKVRNPLFCFYWYDNTLYCLYLMFTLVNDIYIGVSSNTKKAGKSAGCINKNKRAVSLLLWAERGGFEPPKPFWGLLAFQAGQFNHSCIFPFAWAKIVFFVKSGNRLIAYRQKIVNLRNKNHKTIL